MALTTNDVQGHQNTSLQSHMSGTGSFVVLLATVDSTNTLYIGSPHGLNGHSSHQSFANSVDAPYR